MDYTGTVPWRLVASSKTGTVRALKDFQRLLALKAGASSVMIGPASHAASPILALLVNHGAASAYQLLRAAAGFSGPENLPAFLPALKGHHILVQSDNTTMVAHINHQGGLRSHSLYRMAQCLLFWTQNELLSIRAVHVPGSLSLGADILSRGNVAPGEWRLHPHMVQKIWSVFGRAEMGAFAALCE
ncbi:hypothetical protein M9458_026125, partial [Cirrhinus mrigala]